MTVTATDYDDPRTDNARIEYSIVINVEIDGEPVLRIDSESGKIYAMVIPILSFFLESAFLISFVTFLANQND